MIREKRIALAVCLLILAADASAQSFLEKLNNGLKKVNDTLEGATAAPATTSNPLMATPTDQQIQHIAAQVTSPTKPPEVASMIEEASKVIGDVILTSSCYANWGIGRYLGRYAAPNASTQSFLAPMSSMTYHVRSQCLTVERLDNWHALAKNAFGFRAVYVSGQSGETSQLNYQFVRQPDGIWLLKNAGF